jgi:hypothetical protein
MREGRKALSLFMHRVYGLLELLGIRKRQKRKKKAPENKKLGRTPENKSRLDR